MGARKATARRPSSNLLSVGVIGPDDPSLSASNFALIGFKEVVPITTSGLRRIDARDLADAHLHMLENPHSEPEAARYIFA